MVGARAASGQKQAKNSTCESGSRDDLALAAMHGRIGDRATNAAPQRQGGAPCSQRRAPTPAPAWSGDTNGADAGKRLAQATVGLDDEQREVQRARPGLPLRHDVGACVSAIERERQAWIAVLEHDRDGAGVALTRRLDPDRDAQIGGGPYLDGHLDAAHGPAEHNVIARKLDHAHAPVCGPVSDRKPNRESERVEPLMAARPGRRMPADCCLTPQLKLPAGLSPVRLCPPEVRPPVVAANMPHTLRNPLNVPG